MRRGDSGEHWLSVSDLMAGVVAVVLLFFVVAARQGATEAALRIIEAQRPHPTEAHVPTPEEIAAQQRAAIMHETIIQIANSARALGLARGGPDDPVQIDVEHLDIQLNEGVFEPASACLSGPMQSALHQWEPILRGYVRANPSLLINIEGFTDNQPLSLHSVQLRVGRDARRHRRFPQCALFSDNYTLSAARASQARETLLGENSGQSLGWTDQEAQRVLVVGHGGSNQRRCPGGGVACNRRVEINLRGPDAQLRVNERDNSPQPP